MKKVKIIIPEKSMNYKLKKSNKFGYSFCVSMAAGLIMFGIFYSGAYILATSGPTTTIQNSENKLDIISISNIPEINIEYGVTPTLPATISVTLSNGIMANPAVLWDSTPEFNANIAGTYIFKGTPITTPLIINTKNLTAELNVIVAKQVIEETIEEVVVAESIPTIGELIQSSVVGFLDEMWKFSKWSFNYYLEIRKCRQGRGI
jgi:hypothetical protein